MSNTTTYKFDTNAPFFRLLEEGRTTFVGYTEGGQNINRAVVKLTFDVGAMRMFCKGIVPARNFRLKDIKYFYGVKGNKQKVYDSLLALSREVTQGNVPA
jgi:hypothetical protein